VYTHAHVLEIVARQRGLNFRPGTSWSYSNTGYNLAAVIVARVSGQPFAEFTRQRIFEPLGMKNTSWRDDYTRVVKGRAIAYSDGKEFRTLMPFENVHGNGGLLTTVGDLLRWNSNFSRPRVGDAGFVTEQQEVGRLADGRPHGYALGLRVGEYKGVREVSHGGSTAGYRAFLARYPDNRLSVAVLCNVSSAEAEGFAHAVADIHLGSSLAPRKIVPARLKVAQIEPLVGLYRNTATGLPLVLALDKERLVVGGMPQPPVPTSPTRFEFEGGSAALEFVEPGRVRVVEASGLSENFERVELAQPGRAALEELSGIYVSDEAEVAFRIEADGDGLRLLRSPDTAYPLQPLYADAFGSPVGIVRFKRDDGGRVTGLGIAQDRVWDLPLTRR